MRLELDYKRFFIISFKAALLIACVVFLYTGLDWEKLLAAVKRYETHQILVVLLAMSLGVFIMGLRLWDLAERSCSLGHGVFAAFYGFFANNVLPARLGEVAKIVYLYQVPCIQPPKSTEFVFWERFADLNVFLVLVAVSAFILGEIYLLLPFGGLALITWILLVIFSRNPPGVYRVIRYVPIRKIKEFLKSFLQHVEARTGVASYVRLMSFTVLLWLENLVEIFLILFWLAAFDLTFSQGLVVFALIMTGLSLPLAPAGLGVVDTAIVFSLGLYGIEHNEALAASLIWRVVQYIITVSFGLLLAVKEGAAFKDLLVSTRRREGVSVYYTRQE